MIVTIGIACVVVLALAALWIIDDVAHNGF